MVHERVEPAAIGVLPAKPATDVYHSVSLETKSGDVAAQGIVVDQMLGLTVP